MRIALWLGVIGVLSSAAAAEWQPLFGENLDGWTTLGGEWTLEDGVVIGTAGPGENAFLLYERPFGDLEFEVEWRTPVPTNGGVQFHSHWLPQLPYEPDGPRLMYGYQANVETRQRTASGRLIDENGRGPLAETPREAAMTLKQRDWNTMRVVAQDGVIEVYLHDVLAHRTEDEAYNHGYIALQSFAFEHEVPVAVEYRNLRVRELGAEEDWSPLFDGASLNGWKVWGTEEWTVQDGIIEGRSGPDESEGYLATEATWTDFHVRGEYRMLGDGNYGLFYHSTITPREDGYPVIAGVQGEVAPGWPSNTGWLYESYQRGWLVEPDMTVIPAFAQRPGEWNRIEVRSVDNHVTTWVNGIRVVDFDDPDPRLTEGSFALQLHTGGAEGIQWRALEVKPTDAE